jgi:hypothetical protein
MRKLATLCAILASLFIWSTIARTEPEPKVKLTFIWHAGDRANLLQKIARSYTEQTGVEINTLLPPTTF